MRDETNYIRTFSGGKAWPLDPREEDIKIEDIAHALSQQCRWTGHTRKFYSVAQHCCLVSDLLPTRMLKLEGLLHDASEAYLADLARPIKMSPGLGEIYKRVEKRLEGVIAGKFGLPNGMSPAVKDADNTLLYTEGRDLMGWDSNFWGDKASKFNDTGVPKLLAASLEPWSPERAEEEYLLRFHLLTSPETFTTGEYARSIGLGRHAALARLVKLEKRGIVERVKVRQNQGGIVRPNVLGWKFLGNEGVVGGRGRSTSESRAEALAQGDPASSSGS